MGSVGIFISNMSVYSSVLLWIGKASCKHKKKPKHIYKLKYARLIIHMPKNLYVELLTFTCLFSWCPSHVSTLSLDLQFFYVYIYILLWQMGLGQMVTSYFGDYYLAEELMEIMHVHIGCREEKLGLRACPPFGLLSS